MSLGLALSRSGHSPQPHPLLFLSLDLSVSLSLNRPLLDGNLIAIESRDNGREQGEERWAFQLGT